MLPVALDLTAQLLCSITLRTQGCTGGAQGRTGVATLAVQDSGGSLSPSEEGGGAGDSGSDGDQCSGLRPREQL